MILVDSLMDLSCRRFARHVAMEVEPLGGGFYRRLQFWVHWAICPFCRRYWKELKAIGDLQRASSAVHFHPVVRMADIKDRLKKKLIEHS
jgi:hypothetical protein